MTVKKSDGMVADTLVLQPLDAVQHGGKLRINVCKYVGDGTEAAADVIQLCKLPKGAKLIPHLCYVNGNQATTKAYLTGYTNTAGNALNAYSTFASAALNADEALLGAETIVTATLVGGGITANNAIYFGIVYAQL